MSHRVSASLSVLAAAIAFAALASVPVVGQSQTASAGKKAGAWTPARTPWGDPDLQGQWTNTTMTRLERPDELKGKAVFTDEELAEQNKAARLNIDRPPRAGDTGVYNNFWLDRGQLNKRTSLVMDPPDGKLPPLTPEGQKRNATLLEVTKRSPADGPESRNLYERCITRGMPGAMMPGFYNHNYHILQTPGYVVIQVEMIHDARIIPLDGRPHLDKGIGQWLGDSRGHWDGNTLVVETTNLKDVNRTNASSSLVFGTSGEMSRVVERFTRVSADAIDYQVTVDDPVTYSKPWTAMIPMSKLEGGMFEYACQEGNYALPNILAGARAQEKRPTN